MNPSRIQRVARQNVQIDQLLGVDFTPLSDRTELVEAMVEAVEPDEAAESPAPPPSRQPAAPAAAPSAARSAPASSVRTATASTELIRQLGARVNEPLPEVSLSAEEKAAALAKLAAEHESGCTHCCSQKVLNMVFGEGNPDADLMFIGEGPGADEDRLGRPFVGRAGQLLDKQIQAMGLQREDVYIANIVKTRPPANRVPTPDEAQNCIEYLHKQIEIIQPRVIVSLGATSAKYLLGEPRLAITRERGQWRSFRGIALMPTFHPAYLLRAYTRDNRARVWEDLKAILHKLDLPVPG